MVEVVMMAVGRTISSFSEAAPPQPWRARRGERERERILWPAIFS